MWYYCGMRKPKDGERIDERKRILISAEIAGRYGLPKKAIGVWIVVEKSKAGCRLRKVRQDGFLMSDKYNNHQFISTKIAEGIGVIRKAKKKISIAEFKISTRKKRWIDDVILAMKADDKLMKYISKISQDELTLQIYDDTSASREGGKLYSSLSGALRIWRKRCRENSKILSG